MELFLKVQWFQKCNQQNKVYIFDVKKPLILWVGISYASLNVDAHNTSVHVNATLWSTECLGKWSISQNDNDSRYIPGFAAFVTIPVINDNIYYGFFSKMVEMGPLVEIWLVHFNSVNLMHVIKIFNINTSICKHIVWFLILEISKK